MTNHYHQLMMLLLLQGGKQVAKSSQENSMQCAMEWVDARNRQPTPEEMALQQIREAELAKTKMFPPTGEEDSIPFELIARVNQDYEIVGNHLDETVQNCIIKGQYIDFGKLLPKDRILVKEDGHLELTVKNGKTFWSPISEVVSINCFNHWEQAFHIFSNIYTKAHPHRASELIQYNHIIYTISLTYVWDNVYTYDKEFRIHMSCHPERNWLVILQQAWAMHLKDRLMGN